MKFPGGNPHPLGYRNWARAFQTFSDITVMVIDSLKKSVHLAL